MDAKSVLSKQMTLQAIGISVVIDFDRKKPTRRLALDERENLSFTSS
jgi:hypothetical protein